MTSSSASRRMRPSLYYDESEMTLKPNSVKGKYGHMLTEPRHRDSFSSSADRQSTRQSTHALSAAPSSVRTDTLVPNLSEIVTYTHYNQDLDDTHRRTERNNLILQVVILIVSFCYWVVCWVALVSWYLLVHGSYYLSHLVGVNIATASIVSVGAAALGALASAMMFFFAVRPLSVRKSPSGEESLQTLTILLVFCIGFSLCALVYSASVTAMFLSRHSANDASIGEDQIYENDFEEIMKKSLANGFSPEFGKGEHNKFWDTVQFQLGCCGVYNQRDWHSSDFSKSSGLPFPMTCCIQLPEYFGDTEIFVYVAYQAKTYERNYIETVYEAMNQSCYRGQKLSNFQGCGEKLEAFYSYLATLFLAMDMLMFLLAFTTVILMPVAV